MYLYVYNCFQRANENDNMIEGMTTVMYPPKNGPRALAKRLDIDESHLPDIDVNDELTDSLIEACRQNYGEEMTTLNIMGYMDELRNIRSLLRHKGNVDLVVQEFSVETNDGVCIADSIYIGDHVTRGPDWKWGNQDGQAGLVGTVRALRQWHPKDPDTCTTEVIVFWDIGVYGNYRFGYRGAYDVKVVERCAKYQFPNSDGILLEYLAVGDIVKRAKPNWRWDNDASPAPLANGIRVGVLWDKDKEEWQKITTQYKEKKRQRAMNEDNENSEDISVDFSNEKCDLDKKEDSNDHTRIEQEFIAKCQTLPFDPHCTNFKSNKRDVSPWEPTENLSVWEEMDFEDVLAQPLPRYRWGLEDSYDLTVIKPVSSNECEYLMVDDRIKKGPDFKFIKNLTTNILQPPSGDYSDQMAVVLRVEQWDVSRVEPRYIRGDKVFTQWSSRHGFRFHHNGNMDVIFVRRGQLFRQQSVRIRVGDRVQRSMFWDERLYGQEDGGDSAQGTVAVLQFVLETSGILAKVRWHKNSHVNLYSWGFSNIYDIAKVDPGSS
ncbi:skeletrophin [Reticulomyxa filosa]|uniref:Skeletrophin n=1 Tax=Reticulomyxa filosa TaxID=46433 RepID=X6MTU5_RETFI|nr:skeletrophin [Reticulomyxa filosa]|eukprot:ETO17096.1 skeletrophin [Reticulomyxa filosa]